MKKVPLIGINYPNLPVSYGKNLDSKPINNCTKCALTRLPSALQRSPVQIKSELGSKALKIEIPNQKPDTYSFLFDYSKGFPAGC